MTARGLHATMGAAALLASLSLSASAQDRDYEGLKYVGPGSRLDWCQATSQVVFDKLNATDGYYDLYIGLASTNARCLTCTDTRWPAHSGNPACHPSGQYIAFQSLDVTLPFLPVERQPIAWLMTNPGWGTNNNLWLITRDGTSAWLLRQIGAGQATLHPQFSRDGGRLLWAERIGLNGVDELWTMKLADFVWEEGQPALRNIADIAPFGNETLYETFGFSSDDSALLFAAGDPVTRSLDIYTYNVSTGLVQNLTNTPNDWDEHARMSPDGTKIIWASSRDITITRDYFVPFLDYWTMNADGSNPRRLTYFNDPTAPEYYDGGVVTADNAFSADGKTVAARLELTKTGAGLPRDVYEAVLLIKLK